MKTIIIICILLSATFAFASSPKERDDFAKLYENLSLSRGQDVTARALGKNKTTFKLTYVMINRPFVHRMINDPEFVKTMNQFGFKRIVLSNGYGQTWTFNQ